MFASAGVAADCSVSAADCSVSAGDAADCSVSAADCSVSAADCPVSAGDCSFILSGIRGRTQMTLIPKFFNNNFLDPGNDLWFCFPGSSGIPDKYFYDCILLKKLIIPNCISKIGFAAFSRCSRLKSIIIPNSVNTISDYAFSNCSALTNIVISNKINEIGESVFFGMFITYKYCNSK